MATVILSASRMTDMPAWYPAELIAETRRRINQATKIHTLVLWSKHPAALLREPLFSFLNELKEKGIQLFIQLTITGMGGKICGTDATGHAWKPEPHAPSPESSLNHLPRLISLTEHPDRILLRIDPLLKVKDAKGQLYSNIPHFKEIAQEAARMGIHYFTFSLVQPGIYRKVDRRFEKEGITLLPFLLADQEEIRKQFIELELRLNIHISACCVEGWPSSACIDGEKLMKLHPEAQEVSLRKPHSRPLCGCTVSTDLGGWPPKVCPTGCIYCYARPQR